MANLYKANKKGGITPTGTKQITSNGTHDVTAYDSAEVNVPSESPNLQTKTITAGTSAKTVQPDSGYDGFSEVTVNPTPSQTKSVTATTSTQFVTPDSGNLLSQVTVNPQSHTQNINYTSNGAKDLGANHDVRYVNINVPSSGYNYGWDSETTLWTNSNPTSSSGFANQTVPLNYSMSNYNYIKIYGHVSNSNSSEIYTIVKRSDFTATGSSSNSTSVALGARSSGGVSITRTAWYVSSTEVGFSAGFSASGIIPQACIPTKITGLR